MTSLLVLFEPELKEKLREVALKNKKSMGEIIRIVLKDRFKFKELEKEEQENNGTGQSIGNTDDGSSEHQPESRDGEHSGDGRQFARNIDGPNEQY